MRPIDADALIEFCAERWIPLNIDAVNMQPTIQPEKAQLSCGGTTSDLISRQQTLNALMDAVKSVGVLDADDIKTVFDALPSVQHEKAQLSCGGTTKDTISRQAAIDALMNNVTPYGLIDDDGNIESGCKDKDVVEMLYNLPTVQPEPKEGHWIPHETPDGGEQYECSRCGVLWEFNDGTPEDNEAYFCPKCGTKMKGESNE